MVTVTLSSKDGAEQPHVPRSKPSAHELLELWLNDVSFGSAAIAAVQAEIDHAQTAVAPDERWKCSLDTADGIVCSVVALLGERL